MVAGLNTGYDTGYLTEGAGVGYYTGADAEPPGYWQGKGAAALGLSGQVDADVMRRLFHEDIGPDGQVLARRQKPGKYQAAEGGSLYAAIEAEVQRQVAARGRFIQPEEIRQIRLEARARLGRNQVPFYDLTYSAPKSVSVLWASLLQAAAEAEADGREADAERLAARAEQIEGAIKRANDRMIAVAERELAYIRTGHHSKTSGEWRDAEGFIAGSFPQHTNRDGDPQLHVHNAIANRAQRADGADEKWRALHAHPLFRNKLRLGTLGDRFAAQELEKIGVRGVLRPDGMAIEVAGISEEATDLYSARTRDVQAAARELAADYEARNGHAPDKRAWFKIKQRAALETRDPKDHSAASAGQRLAAWARKAARSGADLGSLHEAATAYAAEHPPSRLPGDTARARIIRKAVAAVQAANATWDRSQLILELGHVVPQLPAETDPEAYLNELAEEAVSGRAEGVTVLQIAPVPDAIDVARLGLRKDGTSIYRAPCEERFCTAEHRDTEAWLVDAALIPRPRRVTEDAADAALAGTDLDYSQRQAAKGLLTSTRLINCLVAPAGTGKTHVLAAFAEAWRAETGGRVIGLTASENAARVLAGEGLDTAVNIAQFLGKIKGSDRTRGHMEVYPGDVLVVDEATQASTADAMRIAQIARRSGAMVISALDPAQLGAVDAGGIFPLIAARHGSYRLTEVRRFTSAWEAAASLRLREGDVGAMAEYAGRGRVWHGPRDRVHDDAVAIWVSDHLRGKDTLLLAASNEEAAHLARLVRERLIELRQIGGTDEITLADGNKAGTGDLVRARLNTRIDADGQTLANRDTVRIEGWQDSGLGRLAVVSRRAGPGQWSRPFFVPAAYLEKSAELDYAGNVHVAQGRTVDTGHLVVSEGMTRSLFYTGITRGREKNTVHVVTGAPDPAQPARAEREAYTAEAIHRAHELRQAGDVEGARAVRLRMPDKPSGRQLAPWEAIVAQAMQRDDPERTALEEIQASQDYAVNMGHLLQLSEAFWRLDVVPQIDAMVRDRIGPREYERYLRDPERPAFLQALREHEIGGRDIPDVLDVITAAPLDGARSIAGVLHGRAGKLPAPERGRTAGWAERAPRITSAQAEAAGHMMDARQGELGRQVATRPPQWALEAWGVPPAEAGPLRQDWERRAGIVQAYREAAGITGDTQAIGPAPGQAQIREAFGAAVTALALPDDAALLRAMGRGDLEAAVDEYDRAVTFARPDVQAELGEREQHLLDARTRADVALGAGNTGAAAEAGTEARDHEAEVARLAVADAARREWLEANAGKEAAARAAAAELQRRELTARVPEAGGADEHQAEAEPEDSVEIPQFEAETEAEFQAWLHHLVHGPEAEPEASAATAEPAEGRSAEMEAQFQERLHQVVTDAETQIRDDLEHVGERIGELGEQIEADQVRQAAIYQAYRDEPQPQREPEAQAEAVLDASWQPGSAQGQYEAEAGMEMEL